MTIDGFSKLKEASSSEDDIKGWNIKSDRFCAGGHTWYIDLHPSPSQDEDEDEDEDWMCVTLYPDPDLIIDDDDMVKVWYEVDLLTRAGESVASAQSSFSFTSTRPDGVYMLEELNASPLLGDSFQVRCDLTIVIGEIAAVRPPDMHRHLGGLLASQVGGDVTFNVGGELFTVHKCILAARSPVFMAELFGPAGKDIKTPTIDDMEPRVFKALLHFIYTDTLPEVVNDDDDKFGMALGLLDAAHRCGMERLKLICEDIMGAYVDEITAVAALKMAETRGFHRLKQVCIKILKDLLARVAP
ncbi:unnamed protein product [Urochloa decumbens]|uniref:BTB domain-containing protein n=1 Tax=Urochloa decumbens TaxID=240449 RepID=A0ABC9B342_9POAL